MPEESQSDIDLLQACIQGKSRAFEGVVSRYQSLVCAITYSGTGSLHKSEELAQETFILAWKNLTRLRDLNKFRAWLCRIARSTVQNWQRSRKRDVVARAASLDAAADQAAHTYEPVEAAIHREQEQVVHQALHRIPANYREPLVLFYRENKSAREVAALMGLSENTTRQRISRARAMLKKQVAAMVETTLTSSRPGRAFTAGVMASLAGIAIKGTTTVGAAQVAVSSSGLGLTAALSGIAGKITLVAAGVAIITGGVLLHRHLTTETQISPVSPDQQQAAADQTAFAAPQDSSPSQDLSAAKTTNADSRQSNITDDSGGLGPNTVQSATQVQKAAPGATGPYEFKARGVLSGLITDSATGAPIQDALVDISNNGSRARTDEHGFYSIEKIYRPGNCRITVASKAYVGIGYDAKRSLINLSQDKQMVRHFQLPRACMVNVRVLDANGVGIQGARVVATSLADDLKREIGGHGMPERTDHRGELLLGSFPPAQTDYLITVWHEVTIRKEKMANGIGRVFMQYDYAAAKAELRLTDPNIIESVDIVLKKGKPVHGYAEYADGVPATDIQIGAQPAWWHCSGGGDHYPVREDGTFTLEHITPGTYDIKMLTTGPGGLPQSSGGVIQIKLPPPDEQPLIIHLPVPSPQSLASISGRVIFPGKEKADDIEVSAYSPSLGRKHVYVPLANGMNPDQTFHLSGLEPGDYRVTFSGREIQSKTLENVTAPCDDLEVELETANARPPSLTGTVVDAHTGTPIREFRVRLLKQRTLRGANSVPSDQWISFSGKDGRFDIESVGPGIYQVQVMAQAYAPLLSEEINTDQPTEPVLALTPGGTVTGRVLNQTGKPIDGAKVIPLSYAGGTMTRTRAAFASENGACRTEKGLFTLGPLPAGTESLKVTHPDYAFRIVEGVEVHEKQITADIEVVLTPGGTVEGVVWDEHGQALANQVLYVQDDDGYSGTTGELIGRLATAVTDSNGFYRARHLPEQLCYINRAAPWKTIGVVRRTVMPLDGRTVTVDFGGEPIVSGSILIQGKPLAQRRIQLRTLGSSISARFKCFAMTDEQGHFAFRGAVPGTYTIHYEMPNSAERWEKLIMFDVADANLDLGVIGSADAELLVRIQQSSAPAQVTISMLSLSESPINSSFMPAKYLVHTPPNPGDPWIVPDVVAGTYTLVLMRDDFVQLRREISLESDQKPWEISWRLPDTTARLSGSLDGSRQAFLLWQDSGEVLATVMPDEQGEYSLKNLPAGSYFAGTSLQMLYKSPASAQITLSAGEHKQFNPDMSIRNAEQPCVLSVQVIDDNGTLRSDLDLSLTGDLGDVGPFSAIEGNYIFMASSGAHLLHVVAHGYHPIEKAVTLTPIEPGTKPKSLQIRLERL